MPLRVGIRLFRGEAPDGFLDLVQHLGILLERRGEIIGEDLLAPRARLRQRRAIGHVPVPRVVVVPEPLVAVARLVEEAREEPIGVPHPARLVAFGPHEGAVSDPWDVIVLYRGELLGARVHHAQRAQQVRGLAHASRPDGQRRLHREHRPHELLLLHLRLGRIDRRVDEPVVVDQVLDVLVQLDELAVVGLGEEPVRREQLRGGFVAVGYENLLAGFVRPDAPHLKNRGILRFVVQGVQSDHLPRLRARPLAVVYALFAAFGERLS